MILLAHRPLDTHFDAFLQMGVDVKQKGKFNQFEKKDANNSKDEQKLF